MPLTQDQPIEKIRTSVRDIDPKAEIHLYGSRARHAASTDSDWDVLVNPRHSPTLLLLGLPDVDIAHHCLEGNDHAPTVQIDGSADLANVLLPILDLEIRPDIVLLAR